ncbi:MAG: sigma-54-dependent Fis family transcriptional regulator [Peptococcaceae bacterium]|nr:sigma-54-dependent Fis family transcriptional regulator [Peptococcaceae bacterium]
MLISSFFNQQDIIATSGLDAVDFNEIRLCKERFLQDKQNLSQTELLEPEVVASWQRSKKYRIDPQMREVPKALNRRELEALIRDKKTFIELAKTYFNMLLPLLNIYKTTLCIQDENGTFLDFYDRDRLLSLKPICGSIWNEETVGTSSTSLCLEHRKIVQLVGPRHYCKVLENHLATTTPICDSQGNVLGLMTIVNHLNEEMCNEKTLQRILLWIINLRYIVENQLELSKKAFAPFKEIPFATVKGEDPLEWVCERKYHQNKETVLTDAFSNILGESPQIKNTIKTALQFAQSDCGILITGESGTGKELFAQAIHKVNKDGKPFATVNCAGIPATLISSELFGYVGGAFTGADYKGRQGKIELAQDGTLFLDEIGDMPLEVQPSLLRVLEDKKVTRLGSNRENKVTFRLIAATNKDLWQLVAENKFRADLYYRLGVLELELPPLRERGRDILLLANLFLEEICRNTGRTALKLNKETEKFMLNYSWPGNVRQLKNAMIYAASICPGKEITLQHLPKNMFKNLNNLRFMESVERFELPYKEMPYNETSPPFRTLPSLKEMEQEAIKKALFLTGNNMQEAAKMLGLSKTSIYRKAKEYNIDY